MYRFAREAVLAHGAVTDETVAAAGPAAGLTTGDLLETLAESTFATLVGLSTRSPGVSSSTGSSGPAAGPADPGITVAASGRDHRHRRSSDLGRRPRRRATRRCSCCTAACRTAALLLDAFGAVLTDHYRVVSFDRRGHGRTADTDAPFHYADMATETIGVLESVVGGPAHLVGWSDGGIVSLHVALRRPDLVRRMVVIGTNVHHDAVLPLDLDPSSPFAEQMYEAYAAMSPDGGEHFGVMFERFLVMATTEPTMAPADLAPITAPDARHGRRRRPDPPRSHVRDLRVAARRPPGDRARRLARPAHRAPDLVGRLVVDFLASPDPPSDVHADPPAASHGVDRRAMSDAVIIEVAINGATTKARTRTCRSARTSSSPTPTPASTPAPPSSTTTSTATGLSGAGRGRGRTSACGGGCCPSGPTRCGTRRSTSARRRTGTTTSRRWPSPGCCG